MYEVIRKLAGEYYAQSSHDTEDEARKAAIQRAGELNFGYTNTPYTCGVRHGDTIITEDATADRLRQWDTLTPEQQAAER